MRYESPALECLGPRASLLNVQMGLKSLLVECAESTELHALCREAVMVDQVWLFCADETSIRYQAS